MNKNEIDTYYTKMNCYDVGFIRYGEMKNCSYEQILEEIVSAFKRYSNEFCLHPKYLNSLEVDGYLPQINIESITEDGELSNTNIECYNSSLLRNETNDSFVSSIAYLSGRLYKEFRERALSEYCDWAKRFPILIISDCSFLRVLSIIKDNEAVVKMPYVLLGVTNNIMVCYDSYNNSIDFIKKAEQIADVILFNSVNDYSFPRIEDDKKDVLDKEVLDWGD